MKTTTEQVKFKEGPRTQLQTVTRNPIVLAALEAVNKTSGKAKYADIGRAVNAVKGRRTTSRRSNVYWGRRIALQLQSCGLIDLYVVRGEGAYKDLQDRCRLTTRGTLEIFWQS